MATTETASQTVLKKVVDLRVVDLKAELEKRELDKNGVKAVLLERLQKALEDDGIDPDEHLFEVASENTLVKKSIPKRTGRKAVKDNVGEESSGENSQVNEEEEPENDESKEPDDSKNDELYQFDDSKEDLSTADIVDDSINLSVGDEEAFLIADEEVSEENELPNNEVDIESMETLEEVAQNSSAEEEKNEEELEEGEIEEVINQKLNCSPPRPDAAPVLMAPLTVNDTIELDTSLVPKPDDNVSLIVNIDDTLNDLDMDLVPSSNNKANKSSPEQKTNGQVSKKNEVDISGDGDNMEIQSEESNASKSKPLSSSENKTKEVATKPASIDKLKSKGKDSSANKVVKPKVSTGKVAVGKNLWVSGLTSTTRATDLKTLFSKYGKVLAAKIVTNAKTPGAKCYGFVTMISSEVATKCIQNLHHSELHGQLISIERAKTEPGSVGNKPKTQSAKKPVVKKAVTKATGSSPVTKTPKAANNQEKKPEDKKENTTVKKEIKKKDDGDKRKSSENSQGQKSGKIIRNSKQSSSRERSYNDFERKRFDRPRHQPPDRMRKVLHRPPMNVKRSKVLTFEKIREARARERLRKREREMRADERTRQQFLIRQNEIEKRQREESVRLERERLQLQIERQKLERERVEVLRLEREKTRAERERIEREREELRRREQVNRIDNTSNRHGGKRSYESNNRRDSDPYWDSRRSSNMQSSQIYESGNVSMHGSNRDRMGMGINNSDNYDRRDERIDRRENKMDISSDYNDSIRRRDAGGMIHDHDDRRNGSGRDADLRGRDHDRSSGRGGMSRERNNREGGGLRRSQGVRDEDRNINDSRYSSDHRGNSDWSSGNNHRSQIGGQSRESWVSSNDKKIDNSQNWNSNDRWGSASGSGRSAQNIPGINQGMVGQPSSMYNSNMLSNVLLGNQSSNYGNERYDAYKNMNSVRRY